MITTRRSSHTFTFEAIAVIASLVLIAFLAAADIAHGAPTNAPIAEATFDVAPAVATTSLRASELWAADESAQGTRPDSVH